MKNRYFKSLFYIIIFSSLFCFDGFSQQKVLDSLMLQLDKSEGRERVDILNKIANHKAFLNANEGLKYATESISLSRKINYVNGEAEGLHQFAGCQLRLDAYKEVLNPLMAAQKILLKIKDYDRLAENYSMIGDYFTNIALFDKAAVFHRKSMKLAKKINNNMVLSRSYYKLGLNYQNLGNFKEAIKYYNECITIGTQIKKKFPVAVAREGIGQCLIGLGKYDEGMTEIKKAMDLFLEGNVLIRVGSCYNMLGHIYMLKTDYIKAVEYCLKALKIFEEVSAPQYIGSAYNELGMIHCKASNFEEAISYFKNALRVFEEIKKKQSIPTVYVNLGLAYTDLKKYDSALMVYKKGLKIAKEIKTEDEVHHLEFNMALLYGELQKYDSALFLFRKNLALAEKVENAPSEINTYNNIATLYLRMGNTSKAMPYLKKALELSTKNGDKDLLKDTYYHLSDAYANIHDYKSSLQYYKLYTSLRDSLLDGQKSALITKMMGQYNIVVKDKELAQQKLAIQNQKLAIAGQRNFIIGLIISILILVVVGIFFRYRQKKRQLAFKVELEQKSQKIKQQLELTELKSSFFTNISHEFRTPLTLILTPLEQLAKSKCEESTKKQYEIMQRNANHLLTLVNQILDLSKMESGYMPLKVSEYDIINFLEEIIQSFSPLAETLQIQITIIKEAEHLPLFFDKEKLEKVFHNLIGNALKYTPSGGTISVLVKLTDGLSLTKNASIDRQVEIIIKDNGRGIPKEHVPFIFDRFYQVEGGTEKGTGIGLAISKEIVEMHYGEIQVKSIEGHGTEFIFTLPLGKAHFLPEEVMTSNELESKDKGHTSVNLPFNLNNDLENLATSSTKSFKGNKVLVVEDNADVRQYLSGLLGTEYDVITAHDGEEGLALASQYSPDLIISDIMMPSMDGYEFTSKVKGNLATSHIPIILLTAKADQADKLKGLKIGVDDYIVKPFHADELLIRSKNLIEQRLQLRKLFAQNPFVQPREITVNPVDEKFLKKATQIVIDYLEDQDFDVDKFCKEIGMSRTSLHNKLKALTDQSISKFVRTIRLRKAAELIEQDFMSMTDIAFAVGFSNRQFFIRSFKEQYSMTPTNYKAMIKKRRLFQ